MLNKSILLALFSAVCVQAFGQDRGRLLEALSNQQGVAPFLGLGPMDAATADLGPVPPADPALEAGTAAAVRAMLERLDREIRQAKAAEKGPPRFGADLFGFRQVEVGPGAGGIADDYVLGTGDQLRLSANGSASLEARLTVDGRGCVAVPKVGAVQVAGLSLARARAALEAKVRSLYSRAVVDLTVVKLREVRVFVLGEVYRPGAFLVPSLASVVNVLGLAGGPAPLGSFRRIRHIRAGQVLRTLDLYPLRSEGLGDLNLGFQNGDTLFVPLAENQVRLEGAFTRVSAEAPDPGAPAFQDTPEQVDLMREIRRIEVRLGLPSSQPRPQDLEEPYDPVPGVAAPAKPMGAVDHGVHATFLTAPMTPGPAAVLAERQHRPDPAGARSDPRPDSKPDPQVQPSGYWLEQLDYLKQKLAESRSRMRADLRIPAEGRPLEDQPPWLRRWLAEGAAPAMLFELLPGETAADAVRFAGGFSLSALADLVSLRRLDAAGAEAVTMLRGGAALAGAPMLRGDILTALPSRTLGRRMVEVKGWTRVQGSFQRAAGMRVADLVRANDLLLPDTYLGRGELVRTAEDGRRSYLAFDLGRALAGDAAHDLLLEDRDQVELYRTSDLREPRTLTVVGPVERPGTYEFLEGMRASDLLFRAGLPRAGADRKVAELASRRDDGFGEVRRLDLARLLSTEGGSPVDLRDDAVNPPLRPFDQISVYDQPDFRVHRVVTLSGQVARPGAYVLDSPRTSLRDLVARAGGLTAEAMPEAGLFLRGMGVADHDKAAANPRAGVPASDPTSNGINEILQRLNETKRLPVTGALLNNPLLHGLDSGTLNRLIVDFPALLAGASDMELEDGDQVIIPRRTDVAYVVGEAASPFGAYKVAKGMTVKDLLRLAGGATRNADTWNVRLLKADGKILDRGVSGRTVEPGDAVLVPQRIRRDVSWQENLAALTPVAVLLNAIRK